MFKVTARGQRSLRGLRGHLLHTVTFLVYVKVSYVMDKVLALSCMQQVLF